MGAQHSSDSKRQPEETESAQISVVAAEGPQFVDPSHSNNGPHSLNNTTPRNIDEHLSIDSLYSGLAHTTASDRYQPRNYIAQGSTSPPSSPTSIPNITVNNVQFKHRNSPRKVQNISKETEGPCKKDKEKPKTEKVASVFLSNQNLTEIPNEVFNIEELNWLDVSHNAIRELPSDIKKLTKLRRLACGNNEITTVPSEIGELSELTWLDFTHNRLAEISPELGNLQNLTGLGLSDCRLQEFPSCLGNLSRLNKLGMFNNMISKLPTEIQGLKALVKLDISNNELVDLPKEIGSLKSLTWLNLGHNRLEILPDELGELINLRELGLGQNRLKRLPNLSKLQQLVMLPVYSNNLEHVDDWIGRLSRLEKLDLSCNQLRSLPANIFKLPNLTYLNLKKNKLAILPSDFDYDDSNLSPGKPNGKTSKIPKTKLEFLDLSDNQLTILPYGLSLIRYKQFRILRNDLEIKIVGINDIHTKKEKSKNRVDSLKCLTMNTILNQMSKPNRQKCEEQIQPENSNTFYRLHRHLKVCDGNAKSHVDATEINHCDRYIPNLSYLPEPLISLFFDHHICDFCATHYLTDYEVIADYRSLIIDDSFNALKDGGVKFTEFKTVHDCPNLPFARKFCSQSCLEKYKDGICGADYVGSVQDARGTLSA